MRSKSLIGPFIFSLLAVPALFWATFMLGGASGANKVTQWFFVATVVVEVLALTQAVAARKLFSPSDHGYVTWTLIVAFLVVRLVAEARLVTMSFRLAPTYTEDASRGLYFYIVVLRYLYTLSDILMISAVFNAIRAYKGTGLKFELQKRDYVYILLVCAMPAGAYAFRENFGYLALGMGADDYVATYRLVGVFVGAVIASLSLVIRRYALSMGGGAIARVWNTIAVGGIARVGSFVAFAAMLSWSRSGAQFAEQYLLWTFSCCWLLASLYQQEAPPRSGKTDERRAANV